MVNVVTAALCLMKHLQRKGLRHWRTDYSRKTNHICSGTATCTQCRALKNICDPCASDSLPTAVHSCITCCLSSPYPRHMSPARLLACARSLPGEAPPNCAHGCRTNETLLATHEIATGSAPLVQPWHCSACTRTASYGTVLPADWCAPLSKKSSAACTGGVHGMSQVEAGGAQRGLELCQLVGRAVLQRRLISGEARHL